METRKILEYVAKRGNRDLRFQKFLLKREYETVKYRLCTADDLDFMVDHFLDDTALPGYGLIVTNRILKLDQGNLMAIGLIEGDDVICMNMDTGEISIWLIQTGDGEYIKAAKSFHQFLSMCSLN